MFCRVVLTECFADNKEKTHPLLKLSDIKSDTIQYNTIQYTSPY